MADYHFIYKDTEGATTQWDEIQRKLGNLPPKPAPFKPPPFAPADDPDLRPKSAAFLDSKSPEELEDLEDDLDDDRFLADYRSLASTRSHFPDFHVHNLDLNNLRRKRLAELQAAARVARFGSVVPIAGSDFVREVSQAPEDVWVVVFLFKDGIPECGILLRCLEELATRYPGTKFVKVISTDCIPNYPDRNLPTVLVYNNGAVKGTHVGLQQFGGRKCTAEAVALALCQSDPVLNDGQGGGDSSREAVIEGVRRKFIEKVVTEHEDAGDDYSSD